MSWKPFSDPHEILRRLKNTLSLLLNKHFKSPGRRWFVRGGSLRRVRNQNHLNRLIEKYLPDHPGLFWEENLTLPMI